MQRGWPALLLLLAGCSPSGPLPASGGASPRVVSLNPCTDAVLAEIADPGQLLAISHYSQDPGGTSMDLARARSMRATGGTVEEVLALDPDVVVASSFLSPASRSAFERLGVRVETFGIATSVEDSTAQVRRLGAIVGKAQQAERLAGDIEQAVEDAAPEDGRDPDVVLWQPGGIVAGEQALVADLMRRTGFASLSEKRGLGQADYLSLERVLSDPPEILLVAGQERMQQHPALERLTGMRRVHFDPSLLYCGGPSIIHAARRLAEIRKGAS